MNMAVLRTVRSLLRRTYNLFHEERIERDLNAELAFHLDLHIADNLRSGMSPSEARRHALLKLGGLQQTKESYRDRSRIPFLQETGQDLRYAARTLRKSAVFTVAVVLTLAFGIAANTTIFSMVNALLLRPYRFQNLDALVLIWENRGEDEGFDSRWISAGDAADLTANIQAFQQVALFDCPHFNLSSEGRIDVVRGCRVSANFFQVLGVSPAQGRLFSTGEERPGADQVAVISHSFWQNRLGGNPNSLGATIRLSGRAYTVIGIMPPGFNYPVPRELWVPLALGPAERADRTRLSFASVGRLRDASTIPRARAELGAFSHRLGELFPNTNSNRVFSLLQLRQELYMYTLPLFLLLQAAAVFVLLLACANLANLLFARMLNRQRELAVRSSLGANRIRLARLLTAEILMLCALGGAVAFAGSFWSVRVLRDSISPEWTMWVPGWSDIRVDRNVLLFAFLLSVSLGLVFGISTAIYMRRVNLNEVLKETGRANSPARGRLRNALVSVQLTLALVLLACAGLIIQGFQHLAAIYQGFQPDHVLKFEVGLPDSSYPGDLQATTFFRTALQAVANLPGVSDVAVSSNLPASNVENGRTLFTIEGRPAPSASEAPAANLQAISAAYFSALKIPLLAGRFFTDADNASGPDVVIINQSMAAAFWPASDPLGKRFKLGAPDSAQPWATIVGIVGDARQNWWRSATIPVVYQPYPQYPHHTLTFAMRVSFDPNGYVSSVRNLFSQLDPNIALTEVNSLRTEVEDSIAIVRIMGLLLEIFGVIALLLSSVGLYGVLSENVAQRSHEFGIRLALGAHPHMILNLVLRHALLLASGGLAAGLPLAFVVSHSLAALVFGIVTVSFPVLSALALLLLAVALFSAYLPAHRATRIDPMTALRYE